MTKHRQDPFLLDTVKVSFASFCNTLLTRWLELLDMFTCALTLGCTKHHFELLIADCNFNAGAKSGTCTSANLQKELILVSTQSLTRATSIISLSAAMSRSSKSTAGAGWELRAPEPDNSQIAPAIASAKTLYLEAPNIHFMHAQECAIGTTASACCLYLLCLCSMGRLHDTAWSMCSLPNCGFIL